MSPLLLKTQLRALWGDMPPLQRKKGGHRRLKGAGTRRGCGRWCDSCTTMAGGVAEVSRGHEHAARWSLARVASRHELHLDGDRETADSILCPGVTTTSDNQGSRRSRAVVVAETLGRRYFDAFSFYCFFFFLIVYLNPD
ncbi:hypothetical protein E2542_SST06628 [Spatholobus suberectus]|nr:hypothetical protein E2542_SST06628 [Spatholobus suberectus]